MIPIYNEKYDYLMLYVPKAACSVMRRVYVEFHNDEFTSEQLSTLCDKNKLFHGLANIHSGNRLTPLKFQHTKRFIVTRDPYERALSAYYDKFLYLRNNCTWKTNKLNNLFKLFELTKDIELLKTAASTDTLHKLNLDFEQYLKISNITPKEDIYVKVWNNSFVKYLEFLLLCKKECIKAYDEHHDQQSSISLKFACDMVHQNIQIVQIEDFENTLNNALSDIFDHKNVTRYLEIFRKVSRDPHSRNSGHQKAYENINGSLLNRDYFTEQLKKTNTVLDLKSMLCTKSVELINTLYKQDFNFYNYKILH